MQEIKTKSRESYTKTLSAVSRHFDFDFQARSRLQRAKRATWSKFTFSSVSSCDGRYFYRHNIRISNYGSFAFKICGVSAGTHGRCIVRINKPSSVFIIRFTSLFFFAQEDADSSKTGDDHGQECADKSAKKNDNKKNFGGFKSGFLL